MPSHIVELATGPPSEEGWARLFGEVHDWPGEASASAALLDRAQSALSHWPDALRAAVLTESEQPEEDAWMWSIDPMTTEAPWLRLVRRIVASTEQVRQVPEGGEVERLVLESVPALSLRGKLASFEDAARTVARFPSLQALDLSSARFYPPDAAHVRRGWDLLLSVLATVPLRQLNVSRAPLPPDAIAQLVASPVAARLESLGLSGNRPPLGPDGARVLAGWPRTSTLEAFACAENGLADSGGLSLSESGFFDPIRSLDLNRNGMTDAFLVSLRRRNGAALRVFRIGGSALSHDALRALCESGRLSPGAVLELSDCELRDASVSELLGDGVIRSAAELDLRANLLTDRSVQRFIETPFNTLRALRLEMNRFTSAGAKRLEAWAHEHGFSCTTRPLR